VGRRGLGGWGPGRTCVRRHRPLTPGRGASQAGNPSPRGLCQAVHPFTLAAVARTMSHRPPKVDTSPYRFLVDNEFIAFKTVTPGSGTFVLSNLARGCIDTVPVVHPAGATVWFVSNGSGILGIGDYPAATSIRFQAFNNRSEIPLGSAPIDSVSASNPDRALRVYAPTAVKLNGQSYPASITGELTVSWSHRTRLGTWSYADSGQTATRRTGDRVRHPRLRGARHAGSHGDRADRHFMDLPRGRRDRRVWPRPAQQPHVGEDPDVRGITDPRGDPGD
jgi:hypothetical protein